MPKIKRKKNNNFKTQEFKEKILGDWPSILNFPLIIYFYYIWFNGQEYIDNPADTGYFVITSMLLPLAIGLYCVFTYSKEYNISKFGPSFWIILLGFIYWAFIGADYDKARTYSYNKPIQTNLHSIIFYGSILTGLVINFLKIKNLMKSISFTFGQIPFIFIALFLLKGAMNAVKRK